MCPVFNCAPTDAATLQALLVACTPGRLKQPQGFNPSGVSLKKYKGQRYFEQVALSDFRGKWVLLDFWYVDCHWCRKLTPHLINIYDEWKEEKNFEIISISVDKPKDYDRWLEAIEHDGATWTQVNDSTKTYPLEYGITGYPTMILVDPEGNGVRKIIGYQEEGGLKRILEEYL